MDVFPWSMKRINRRMLKYIGAHFFLLFLLSGCTSAEDTPVPDLFLESQGELKVIHTLPIREAVQGSGIQETLWVNDSLFVVINGVPVSEINAATVLILKKSVHDTEWTAQKYWNRRLGQTMLITNLAKMGHDLVGLDPFGRVFNLDKHKKGIPELLFRLQKPAGRDGLMLSAPTLRILEAKGLILSSLYSAKYGMDDPAYYREGNHPIGVFNREGKFQQGFLTYPEVLRNVNGSKSFRMETIGVGQERLFVHQVPNDFVSVYDYGFRERQKVKLPDMQYLKKDYVFRAVPDSILQISDPWEKARKKEQYSLPPDYVEHIVVEDDKLRLFFVSLLENRFRRYCILDCNLTTGACRETLVKNATNKESVAFFPMAGDRFYFISRRRLADGQKDVVLHEAIIE